MIIMLVSYASAMEQLSTGNIQSNIKPFNYHHCGENFGLFWLKIMFYGFLWDSWMQVTRRFQVQIR